MKIEIRDLRLYNPSTMVNPEYNHADPTTIESLLGTSNSLTPVTEITQDGAKIHFSHVPYLLTGILHDLLDPNHEDDLDYIENVITNATDAEIETWLNPPPTNNLS